MTYTRFLKTFHPLLDFKFWTQSTPGPVYCAECGTPNPAGARMCSECGKMLNPEQG